jgi:hypothetical protein
MLTLDLSNKIDIINQFLDDSKVDIMCISETWLSNQNKDAIKQHLSNNYTTLSNERDTKNGGGTMILINKDYTTNIQHITTKKIEN